MSREDRRIVRYASQDCQAAVLATRAVMRQSRDSRAKLHAAELVQKSTWAEFEHAHPPVQQLEITTRVSNISASFAKIILTYVSVDKRGECSAEMRKVLAE